MTTEHKPHSELVTDDHADVLRLARELVEAYEHASEYGAATDVLKWRYAKRVIELEEQLEAAHATIEQRELGYREQYLRAEHLADVIEYLYREAEHDHARLGMALDLRQELHFPVPYDHADNHRVPTAAEIRQAVSNPATEPRCYCGDLTWTEKQYGRVTHKHACPARTEPWCQTHPEGGCDPAMSRENEA